MEQIIIKKIKQIKFHPSSVKDLMMGFDTKGCQQTIVTHFLEQVMGRPDIEVDSLYTMKGNMVEAESIRMISKKFNNIYTKNTKQYSNDWFVGTPDVIDSENNFVIDAKSRYDLSTYMSMSEKETREKHEDQMQCYMDMLGFAKAYVCNTLVNTPEPIVLEERRKATSGIIYSSPKYQMMDEEQKTLEAERIERNVIKNHTFYGERCQELGIEEIPEHLRINIVEIDRDDDRLDKIKQRIEDARNWLIAWYTQKTDFVPKKLDLYRKIDDKKVGNVISQL